MKKSSMINLDKNLKVLLQSLSKKGYNNLKMKNKKVFGLTKTAYIK